MSFSVLTVTELNTMKKIGTNMKLRDKFAAEALNALVAKLPLAVSEVDDEEINAIYFMMARSAYYYADAMLIARGDE